MHGMEGTDLSFRDTEIWSVIKHLPNRLKSPAGNNSAIMLPRGLEDEVPPKLKKC